MRSSTSTTILDNDFVAQDASGHGTEVAAIARRVAPGANVIVLRVLDSAGRGDFANVEKALQWVVANATRYNVAAVNLSFGDGTGQSVAVGLYGLGDEFAALTAKGVVVVAAAGNNHATASGIAYPAADPNVLAVGAVFAADVGSAVWGGGAKDYTTAPDRIASFSQRDSAGNTLFAPGAYVATVGVTGAAAVLSGTSAATPQVAAAVAVAQQVARQTLGRSLTATEVRQLLLASGVAIQDGDDEQDNVTNTGATYRRLDVYALAQAVAAFTPGTTPPATTPGTGGTPAGSVVVLGAGRTVVVTAGQTTAGADLGVYRTATIEGRVFDDADGDGVRDDGEGGSAGVTVYLDTDGNNTRDDGEPTVITNDDGEFTFGGLKPGTYAVRVETPAGRVPTAGAGGANLTVTSGQTATVADFGVAAPDTTPPEVTQFVIQDGLGSRANLDRVAWRFSDGIGAAGLIASGEITSAVRLFNLTTDTEVALTAAQFEYFAFTRTLTWSLDAFTGRTTTLPDGVYEWRLDRMRFADDAGNALATGVGTLAAGVVAFRTHRLAGDVTGDGVTDAADTAAVAKGIGARAGQANWNPDLDVDRDEVITARDRLAVARAQGGAVTFPAPSAPAATTVAAPSAPAADAPAVWQASGTLTDLTPARLVVPAAGTLRVYLAPPTGASATTDLTAALVVRLDGADAVGSLVTAPDGRRAVEVPVTAGQVVTLRVRGEPGVAAGFDALLLTPADAAR